MPNKPHKEDPRIEPASEPAPMADGTLFRILCTHAQDGSFAGWLDYSGPGNWVYLTGDPGTPGGMTFEDYYHGSERFLVPVGTYVGNDRYLGANGTSGDGPAAWNLWARATGISWNGNGLIMIAANQAQHLIDHGNGYVYWSSSPVTALNCKRVPA